MTVCCIWGSEYLAIKVGLKQLPPLLFAGTLSAIAAITLFVIAQLLHAQIPRKRSSWTLMLFLGIFQISLPYGLVFWGAQYIPSGVTALLNGSNPLFVVMFAHVLVNEKVTRLKSLGLVSSFAGLIAVFWQDILSIGNLAAQNSLLASLAVVASAASNGLAGVVAKRHAEEIHPAANVLVQATVGTVVLISLGITTEEHAALNLTATTAVALIYLGVAGLALSLVAVYWLLKKTTATNLSLSTFIVPIVAFALGWAVLQEAPTSNQVLGVVLMLAGVYTISKPTH
jgi:drug/metabolite transporter (DMT)-like permease